MANKKIWAWLTTPLQTETNATETLRTIGKWWYGLAGVNAFLGIIFLRLPDMITLTIDLIIYVLAGYFLPRRKSRTFSVFLLIFALIMTVETFIIHLGLQEGVGGNIILALLALLMGYRAVHATFVYHARVNSQTIWKNVLIVWSITIVANTLVFFMVLVGSVFLEEFFGIYLSDEQMGNYHFVFLLVICAICFVLLTKRFNFVTFTTTSDDETGDTESLIPQSL